MKKQRQIMPSLLTACPSYQDSWAAINKEWHDEPKGVPTYIALSDFAEHLIEKLSKQETGEFSNVFAAIETCIISGSNKASEAIVVGLLEDLQNDSLHDATTPEDFRSHLCPQSEKQWNLLYNFWGGKPDSLNN